MKYVRITTVAVGLSLMGVGLGCTISRQAQARDGAASRTCDTYERCNQVGPGRKYADRAACLTDYRAYWNERWSVQACDGRIRKDGLELCFRAIEATDCQSVLDILNTAFNKCAQSRVCQGG